MHGTVGAVEVIFLLLLAVVSATALLAQRLKIPYSILLVPAGLLLGLVPGMPHVNLNPDVIFLVVLPPLLYSAAWQTSWRDFRYNLVSIAFLAFGLVGFLVLAVAFLAPRFLPGFDWETGFVLGAVVATTDAIAATSIARRVGLPQRIVDVLEGESLINDATGLLALEFGIAMVVSGHEPTAAEGTFRLLWLVLAGVLVGILIALAVAWLERRIDDGPIEITLGLLVPYGTYLAAEAIHASGVLAVVACGLWLSRHSAELFSPTVRLQAWAVWEALTFILNGIVFILIGLQLPLVLSALGEYKPVELAISGLLFSLLVIAVRLAWTFPGAYSAYLVRCRVLGQNEQRPSSRQVFVVGWTGMRGVVALAAALALPLQIQNGNPFPQRAQILFLTFSVILVTLVGQGLTLPLLVRVLGIGRPRGPNCEEQEAQRLVLVAALDHLQDAKGKDRPDFAPVYDDLARHFQEELDFVDNQSPSATTGNAVHFQRHRAISQEVMKIQRRTAISLRNTGRINDEVLRRMERQLDLSEARLIVSVGEEHG